MRPTVLAVLALLALPPEARAQNHSDRAPPPPPEYGMAPEEYGEYEEWVESGWHEGHCGPACRTCGPQRCPRPCVPSLAWNVGFEFTFVKPRFDSNVAFTTTDDNGAGQETITQTEFDYDLELSPRVWLGMDAPSGLGFRVTYWQFDHAAATETASPPANGFGLIETPPFGAIDISSNIPTDVFTASSSLNVYSIDLEGTKSVDFQSWYLLAGIGLRFASVEQTYLIQQRNGAETLLGEIAFDHRLQGVGPTMSLYVARPVGSEFSVFGLARGSLLYGDGESSLVAGEDLDLMNPLTTIMPTSRDDLLPVGELQLGVGWAPRVRGYWHPFVHAALEGQIWGGAGNATSEDGNLGFFGFNVATGVEF